MADNSQASQPDRAGLSRRSVLQAGSLLGGLGGGMVLAGCSSTAERAVPPMEDVSAPDRQPTPPEEPPGPPGYEFFTAQEARTVDAVVARIIPGDENDPGAVQAGVTFYIDGKLAAFETFPETTYLKGPFAAAYGPDEDPPDAPGWVPVPQAQLPRYGYQGPLTARETYRRGLPALDRYSDARFDASFADLSEDQQDQILMALEASPQRSEDEGSSGGAGGVDEGPTVAQPQGGDEEGGGASSPQDADQAREVFADVDPGEFFTTVRIDTIEGMFADPMYGGNRGFAGWRLVGFPGAQRSYSPQEMLHGTDKEPQGMHGLPPMNNDRPGAGREALEQHQPGVQ